MDGYEFARLYVDTEDRDAVRAVVPTSTPQVSVEVRRSDERPSSGGDFITWRTHVEMSQESADKDDGIVAVTSETLRKLRDAGFQVVVSAPFEDECNPDPSARCSPAWAETTAPTRRSARLTCERCSILSNPFQVSARPEVNVGGHGPAWRFRLAQGYDPLDRSFAVMPTRERELTLRGVELPDSIESSPGVCEVVQERC